MQPCCGKTETNVGEAICFSWISLEKYTEFLEGRRRPARSQAQAQRILQKFRQEVIRTWTEVKAHHREKEKTKSDSLESSEDHIMFLIQKEIMQFNV